LKGFLPSLKKKRKKEEKENQTNKQTEKRKRFSPFCEIWQYVKIGQSSFFGAEMWAERNKFRAFQILT